MSPVLPRTLPRMRNYLSQIVERVVAYARGEDRTLMPFCGQGILSPSLTPNRRRQRGEGNHIVCTGRHAHPTRHYHERYHVPDPYANSRIFLVWRWT